MDFFLGPGLDIGPVIRPQLVIANKILLYNSAELEQLLDEELSENPALEVEEVAPETLRGTGKYRTVIVED